MAFVAGLFDSDADANAAMDRLLHQHIKGLETRVIEPSTGMNASGTENIVPIVPNTGAGVSQAGFTPLPTGGAAANMGWLNDLEDVERVFYDEGLKEGATLAMAKVRDEDVEHVRQIFRDAGARTYRK